MCGDTFVSGNVLASSERSFAYVTDKGLPGGVTISRMFPNSSCSPSSTPLLIFL